MSMFETWIRDLEDRHLADLRFAEVARALRALSSNYVERRQRIHEGAALAGAGKRAAFALFYGPLHYLTAREIAGRLEPDWSGIHTCVDLGCGTGAAGAAWAGEGSVRSRPSGSATSCLAIDRNPWALSEAGRTYRIFQLPVRTERGDFTTARWPAGTAAFVAAFAINELTDAARDALLQRLLGRGRDRHSIVVIEPLARAASRWWPKWQAAFAPAGARVDEWRFRVELPEIVARLDRAAGLRHRELNARSLWIPPRPG